MRTKSVFVGGAFTTVLVARALVAPVPVDKEPFTLARAVPNDVFMFVAGRSNPERAFISDYWGEVTDAFRKSGISDDVISLIAPVLNAEQTAEVTRLKERARQLIDGVEWEQLCGVETAFAERFELPVATAFSPGKPPVLMPDMVWMFRGTDKGAKKNYEGLVAILDAIADEVGSATGSDALSVHKTQRSGAEVSSINLLAMATGAPKLALHVALRKNIIIVAMNDKLLNDVLEGIDGKSSLKPLASDPRFKRAFADLPKPEDSMTFFDMQAMLNPMRSFFDSVLATAGAAGEKMQNTGMNEAAGDFNSQSISAYRHGDYEKALAMIQKAYEEDSKSSIVLYNLACFNSLVGNHDDALQWLGKAIEGGFHAPTKIANDSDFKSLREKPRFKKLIERAHTLAAANSAKDIVLHGPKEGEAYRLLMQSWRAHSGQEYEHGLKLVEQAHAVAPNHSRVLYGLACFHSLLGHEERALDFLEKAVESGYCCPRHISKDSDLDAIRSRKRFKLVLAKAKEDAMKMADNQEAEWSTMAKQIYSRIMDAVGIMDYTAAVETTDGYSTKVETITALVPDAKDRPIYPVFGKKKAMTNFEQFLPAETQSFSISGGFDANEMYTFLEDSIRLTGPKGQEVLKKWEVIQKSLGLDIRKDLLGWIDGDSINVTLADGKGSVSLMKVTDEKAAREKVAAGIAFASTQLTEVLGQVAKENPTIAGFSAMMSVRTSPVTHEALEGFENIHFSLSPQPFVWGVAENHLIFGSSADAVAMVLSTARGEHPNIKQNARIMSEAIVPKGAFVAVTLTDKRGMGSDLAAVSGMLSMGVGMAGSMIPKPEIRPVVTKIAGILGKLSPIVRKIDFYKSGAMTMTFDGQQWHMQSVTHYFSPQERQAAATQ